MPPLNNPHSLDAQHIPNHGSAHHNRYMLDLCHANTGSDAVLVLSERRKQELLGILEDFKNLPLTQKNYLELQYELKAAGLLPEQIFANQHHGDRDGQNNHYMSYIVQSWQKMASRGKL